MSFEKAIEHGKEHRKQYPDWRAVDPYCRCHRGCPWCMGNRMHKFKKQEERAKWEIKTYCHPAPNDDS